jgi:hypothetical protein
MRIFTMILLLAVIALGTDGSYPITTLELRGPRNQPAPAPTENRLGG